MKSRSRLRIASLLMMALLTASALTATAGCGPATKAQQITLAPGQQVANIWPLGTALVYKSEPTSPRFDHLLLPSGKSVAVPGLTWSQLSPAMSPDGNTVAYYDGASLILRPLPTGNVTRVPLPDSVGNPDAIRWSPDNRFVLFHWTTKEADGSTASRVYRIDSGASAPTEVIKSGRIDGMGASWSPDGKTVAITTHVGTNIKETVSNVFTYDPATGSVKMELTAQKGFYTLDWSKTPFWQPVAAQRTDAQGNVLVVCDTATRVPRSSLPGSNYDLVGYRFTLIQVQDTTGKVLRELDLAPQLKALGYDASRYNTVGVSRIAPMAGTSQWLLGVECYNRQGQGYSDTWQAYLCYDGDKGTLRTLTGDELPVANGLAESLGAIQGNEGSLISDGRAYLLRRTASGTSLLAVNVAAATVKRLATLGAERVHVFLWDRTFFCADSKAVWSVDATSGQRRDIATAPTGWRILPESIWALNANRIGDQLRWARTQGEADSQQPLQVTIETTTISGK